MRVCVFTPLVCASSSTGAAERTLAPLCRRTCLLKGAARAVPFSTSNAAWSATAHGSNLPVYQIQVFLGVSLRLAALQEPGRRNASSAAPLRSAPRRRSSPPCFLISAEDYEMIAFMKWKQLHAHPAGWTMLMKGQIHPLRGVLPGL